jgi:hypothetical protein
MREGTFESGLYKIRDDIPHESVFFSSFASCTMSKQGNSSSGFTSVVTIRLTESPWLTLTLSRDIYLIISWRLWSPVKATSTD